MDKRIEIVKRLGTFMALWPTAKITDAQLIMYAELLVFIDLADLDAAMLKLAMTNSFVPSVAEIFSAAESIKNSREGRMIPTGEEAYSEMLKEAKSKPPEKEWSFSHPYVAKAAELFGKREFYISPIINSNATRLSFIKTYNSVVEQAKEKQLNQNILLLRDSNVIAKLEQVQRRFNKKQELTHEI